MEKISLCMTHISDPSESKKNFKKHYKNLRTSLQSPELVALFLFPLDGTIYGRAEVNILDEES